MTARLSAARLWLGALGALASLSALAACNAIAGLDDLVRGEAPDGGPAAGDAAGADAAAGPDASAVEVTICTTPPCATRVACGTAHTCALRSDGRIYCWGDNVTGQLGLGPQGLGAEYKPKALAAIESARQIWTGARLGCALVDPQLGALDAGADAADASDAGASAASLAPRVMCWGGSPSGSAAAKIVTPELRPQLGADVVDLTANTTGGCAARANGALQCWGTLPPASAISQISVPTAIPGVPAIRQVTAGETISCARADDGRVLCWGSLATPFGDAGAGVVTMPFPPAARIATSRTFVCALGVDGVVRCSFRLDRSADPTPIPISDITGATDLAAGRSVACARVEGGLECFEEPASSAVPPSRWRIPLGSVTSFCLGRAHGCAVLQGGELRCWGENETGQVGDGSQIKRDAPVKIDLKD